MTLHEMVVEKFLCCRIVFSMKVSLGEGVTDCPCNVPMIYFSHRKDRPSSGVKLGAALY